MSPERMGRLAYWASGGSVAGRRGPISLARAAELLAFLNDAADSALAADDADAAGFCAELAVELGAAMAKALAWRGCASAG